MSHQRAYGEGSCVEVVSKKYNELTDIFRLKK